MDVNQRPEMLPERRRRRSGSRKARSRDAGAAPGNAVNWRWIGACAALALLATGLELDRQTREDPGYEWLVPTVFSNFTEQQRAIVAIESGEKEAAVELTERLLSRMPVPAENLSLYARAQMLAGNEEQANKAVFLAGARGWRDALAQTVLAHAALASGQTEMAADRALALVAARSDEEAFDKSLLGEIIARPGGTELIAKRLVSMPGVQARFANVGATVVSHQAYAQIMSAFFAAGGSVDCAPIAHNARNWWINGESEATLLLWHNTCGKKDRSKERSLAFGVPSSEVEQLSPFAWQYPPHADLTTTVRAQGDRLVLDYSSRNPGTLPIAVRYVQLSPGTHTIALTGSTGEDAPVLRVQCILAGGKGGGFTRANLGDGPASFDVAPGCKVVRVEIAAVGSGHAQGLELTLR